MTTLAAEYKGLATSILQQRGAWQFVDTVQGTDDPSALADLGGWAPYLSTDQKVELLENADVAARLTKLIAWSREHLTELDVAETIRKDVTEGVEKQQREFLLRQQMAAVRKELAELTGKPASEEADYRAKVEAAPLPEKVREAALAEVDKLERTPDESPEVSWIRTWLDTILALPWDVRSEDSYDLTGARAVLDADHTGLEDVKERITEYLAVRRRRAERGLGVVGGRRSGAVLVLVGPPGVGKTSLGESVARAMGRKFVRVALGGVRDEAEIRGHRRTYVGAMSGRIARAITESGSMNPVMLLDEIDKVGSDYRGDPTAALLEVLDPAQNHTFRDHYLEVELDLSDVLFLATANQLESIPGPLLDRMELVRLDGYTEEEKVTIARDHLVPRQIERSGLTSDEVTITDEALRKLAAEYSREAGVRDLERLVARVLRKLAARADDAPAVTVDADDLREYLGRPRHLPESAERTVVAGCGDGPRGHRRRRRRPVRRGVVGGGGDRREGRHHHRSARGGHEGVRADRAVLPAFPRRGAGPAHRAAAGPQRPHPRAGRCRPQGRPERRDHDDHRAGVAAVRPPGALRRRDDRRGLADRTGAADRWGEAEAARRAPSRHHHGADPQPQRAGPRRGAGDRAGETDRAPGQRRAATC